MKGEPFFDYLERRVVAVDSLLCVGVDPHIQDLPNPTIDGLVDFTTKLINQTQEYAAAYKFNIAFYEMFGGAGIEVLKAAIDSLKGNVPVIVDAKRGDISSTAEAYRKAIFEILGADAITVSPYLGKDSILPFIENPENGVFILCKTSNPGARDIQDLLIDVPGQPKMKLYQKIASLAAELNVNRNIGLVIGATQIDALSIIREVYPEMWFLMPGIGAQGGDILAAVQTSVDAYGGKVLIPISRGISRAANPETAAREFTERINVVRRSGKIYRRMPKPAKNMVEDVAYGLMDAGCVKFGDFKLKSGLISPIYFDLRRLVGFPELLSKVADLYINLLEDLIFDHIAPIPYAALPIGTIISVKMGWSMLYPRKETKNYGTKASIEGVYQSGDSVVLLDDLITTGLSKMETIDKLNAASLNVKNIVVLIDRRSSNQQDLGIPVRSIFSIEKLLGIYVENGLIDRDTYQNVMNFLEK